MTPRKDELPDAELERLVSRFLDQSLTPEDAARLEQRLRDEPAAKDYCARALRFDATMQEALDPQTLEWEETRRVVFNPRKGGPAWSMQRLQTLSYGRQDGLSGPAPLRRRPVLGIATVVVLLLLMGGCFYLLWVQGRIYELRNGDFEATDLSRSPTGVSRSILSWQDNFATQEAEICEIARVSGGHIFPRSGRNVVRLQDRAFLNQRILTRREAILPAEPGLKVVLSGWYYSEAPGEPSLRSSLRFVASGYPDMIQYEAASASTVLEQGGWHPLRVELTVRPDLTQPPSDFGATVKSPPPALDLGGRELTLSLDNRSPDGLLYLDDLRIEVVRPGH